MKINWTVRLRNKAFWMAIIPAMLMLIQAVGAVFGYDLDFGEIGNRLVAVVETAFMVLGILGIVNDPTTASLSDSDRAMTYTKPNAGENNTDGSVEG